MALTLTGLSREVARFQSRSAFTGVGFTTNEAEKVVNHPVRRRILMLLMFLGNAGIITVVSSLILTFITVAGPKDWLFRLMLLALGLVILWFIGTRKWIEHHLSFLIGWAFQRWTRLDVRDYVNLLRLSGGYQVIELEVESDDWLAGKTLGQTDLRKEGVIALGIQRRNGDYVGAPKGHTYITEGDMLILYGQSAVLAELDERPATIGGDEAHQRAMVAPSDRLREQNERERMKNAEKERTS